MAIRAICVRCGKPKKKPLSPCRSCGFLPETEYQIARALIFSVTKTVGGVTLGRDVQTLKALSAQTLSGRFYEFNPKEEQRAVEAYRKFRETDDARKRVRRRATVWTMSMLALALIAAAVYRLNA